MTIPRSIPNDKVAAMPWSGWCAAESQDDGVFRARQKIGHHWTFVASHRRAVAYAGLGSGVAVAECENEAAAGAPRWRYRYRLAQPSSSEL